MSSFTDASFNATETVEFNGITYSFAKLSGTSMSGPAVAGIVALMLQANPELTVDGVREALRVTAREDDHTGEIPSEGSTVWGWGKVNAVRAVQEALGINGVEVMSGTPTDAFAVWPNPVGDQLQVMPRGTDQAYHWSLVDATGRTWDSGQGRGPLSLDATRWPAGALVLVLRPEGDAAHAVRLIVD